MTGSMQRPRSDARREAVPLRCLASALLAAAWVSAATPAAAQDPDAGRRIFQQTCAACHTIGGGRLVGPDLKGVTERRSDEWLVRFITDPEQMRKDDPVAIANLKAFGVPMPRLGLTSEQVGAVVAYFKTTQAAPPAGMPAELVPTLIAGLVVAIALTWVGLAAGSKKVDGGLA
jgi:mono/diheme cytochrome c family protein